MAEFTIASIVATPGRLQITPVCAPQRMDAENSAAAPGRLFARTRRLSNRLLSPPRREGLRLSTDHHSTLATVTRRNVSGCDRRHGHFGLLSLTRGRFALTLVQRRRPARALPQSSLPWRGGPANPNVLVLPVRISGSQVRSHHGPTPTTQSVPSGSISVHNQASSCGWPTLTDWQYRVRIKGSDSVAGSRRLRIWLT
jgi:hypothetical protein